MYLTNKENCIKPYLVTVIFKNRILKRDGKMSKKIVTTLLIVVILTGFGFGLYFWRSGGIPPLKTIEISQATNTTTTIPVVSTSLVGIQGQQIIDALYNSKVKSYIEQKNGYSRVGLLGKVTDIVSHVLMLSRNGEILSVPVDNATIWVATAQTGKGKYNTRDGDFSEIKIGDFVSITADVRPDGPLEIEYIVLFSGNIKPSGY